MADLLLVDDDAEAVECLAEVLRASGHRVQTAHNGVEGLEALRASPLPDAVLLDVDMPDLDGMGMARMMRARDGGEENVPIVLSSGRGDLSRLAKTIGTPYAVAKPVDLEHLLDVLGRAVREKRPPTWA